MSNYYAVFLPMLDQEKSMHYRPDHLSFLQKQTEAGRIFAKGRFTDGAGGLVIYIGETKNEIEQIVKQDPYISQGARGYEIHEWEMVK
ncbi:YciI family protein [Virgibacillus oceani]|uniref:YCII-related domain-containing protein n=1 Tax=Virgibacillus oceani TaxID=1479511 RepID=A0A917HRS6_9BACI|nr:YciI family protein [Virgibacillus oceani]GGG88137.1 hypothetical protein GCM10011398_37640 [Virgibacillus oceani]